MNIAIITEAIMIMMIIIIKIIVLVLIVVMIEMAMMMIIITIRLLIPIMMAIIMMIIITTPAMNIAKVILISAVQHVATTSTVPILIMMTRLLNYRIQSTWRSTERPLL